MFERATPDPDEQVSTVAEIFDGGHVVSVSRPNRPYVYRYIRGGEVIGEALTLVGITRCVFQAVEVKHRRRR